jgi:hypothetical protein
MSRFMSRWRWGRGSDSRTGRMAPGTALSPPIVLFLIGFAYILHEEFFKGIDMFPLHPSNE